MEHIINIIENEEKGFFQILHNGGVAFTFDSEIFSVNQMISFVKKTYKKLEVDLDTVKFVVCVDDNIKRSVCGSHKVRSYDNNNLYHPSKAISETEGYSIDTEIYIDVVCDECEHFFQAIGDIVLRPIKK